MYEDIDIKTYKHYKAKIRKAGPSSNCIKIYQSVGEVGDEVDVFVKIVRELKDVENVKSP